MIGNYMLLQKEKTSNGWKAGVHGVWHLLQ